MRCFKVTLCVLDFDDIGADAIRDEIENARYGNRCISPWVTQTDVRDIGRWEDSHPLNIRGLRMAEFSRLFEPAAEEADDA